MRESHCVLIEQEKLFEAASHTEHRDPGHEQNTAFQPLP